MDKTSLATGLAFVTSPLMTQINSDSTDPTHQETSLLSVWSVVISVISGKVSIQIALTAGTLALDLHNNFRYSALACCRMGTSGSASFQSAKKSGRKARTRWGSLAPSCLNVSIAPAPSTPLV